MPEPERPLLADLREHLGAAAADLGQLPALRWELARLELRTAVDCLRRLAVAGRGGHHGPDGLAAAGRLAGRDARRPVGDRPRRMAGISASPWRPAACWSDWRPGGISAATSRAWRRRWRNAAKTWSGCGSGWARASKASPGRKPGDNVDPSPGDGNPAQIPGLTPGARVVSSLTRIRRPCPAASSTHRTVGRSGRWTNGRARLR